METRYTGKDHMAAVFGRGQTDRVAVRTMQGFGQIMGRTGVTGKEMATQPEKFVTVLTALHQVAPSDAMAVLVGDPALFAELVGLTFKEFRAFGPGKNLLDDKSKLGRLEIRPADQYQRLDYYSEICRLGRKGLPDAMLDAISFSPWSAAMMLRGLENMVYDSADDPEFLRTLLRFTTDMAIMIGDGLLDAGVDMLTLGDPSAGCSVISPKMFREWAKPCLQEAVTHFKSRSATPVVLHICGYTDPIMEDMVSLGLDGLSIDAPSSLKKLVGLSQGKIAIEGNFPGELYVDGTKEQIEAKVQELLATAAEPNGYRYILCSGCQVPDNAPLENVRMFLEAGHRYGQRRPVA